MNTDSDLSFRVIQDLVSKTVSKLGWIFYSIVSVLFLTIAPDIRLFSAPSLFPWVVAVLSFHVAALFLISRHSNVHENTKSYLRSIFSLLEILVFGILLWIGLEAFTGFAPPTDAFFRFVIWVLVVEWSRQQLLGKISFFAIGSLCLLYVGILVAFSLSHQSKPKISNRILNFETDFPTSYSIDGFEVLTRLEYFGYLEPSGKKHSFRFGDKTFGIEFRPDRNEILLSDMRSKPLLTIPLNSLIRRLAEIPVGRRASGRYPQNELTVESNGKGLHIRMVFDDVVAEPVGDRFFISHFKAMIFVKEVAKPSIARNRGFAAKG